VFEKPGIIVYIIRNYSILKRKETFLDVA